MKALLSALLVLSVLTGVAAAATIVRNTAAANVSHSPGEAFAPCL
jgi:hypothetical protein